jgi:hypothetical protein
MITMALRSGIALTICLAAATWPGASTADPMDHLRDAQQSLSRGELPRALHMIREAEHELVQILKDRAAGAPRDGQETPAQQPSQQQAGVAPADARFNDPLSVPLDGTVSTTDFVSYPQGDREDRVRFSVTGMNPNAALSGGRARLTIAASCFGTGTQEIRFVTGRQTYACGQTIVDREVTADSSSGSITITAVGGANTYVQWVLTGTAARVN